MNVLPVVLEGTHVRLEPLSPAHFGSLYRELSVDRSTGKNGEQAHITVKVLTAGKTKTELVTVVSTLSSRQTFQPILIGSK